MQIFFKIIQYIFFTLIGIVALVLVLPLLPVPGNYQILTVLSGSMEPAIHTGSVVIIKPSDNYKIGDVITFGKTKKTPITHRISDIKFNKGNPIYTTKGDANNASDNNEITKNNVIGKVLFSVPYFGYAVNTAKKPIGFFLIIIIPTLIIIGDEVRKVIVEVKKIRSKKTNL